MDTTSYIADLHIHSLYSRATSKASNLHGLACWAAIKGIQVVGTGDFTHPGWFDHLTRNLVPAEPGFFQLKHPPDFSKLSSILPPGLQPDTTGIRFVLSAEISSIYKRGGKVRKVHNVLFAPDFEAVRKINTTLAGIGNLESDGRPILGLDSRILLEILLEQAPLGFLVPAHIWTPWFSLFGSKSGFDDIEECFGDLSSEIFALETGLSSDPDMNRTVSALDRFTLISNSDCHSPAKLGREANIFSTGFDFFSMQKALRSPVDDDGQQRFSATIEFYPEEGKYHCDGHRKCGVCSEPHQTVKENGVCPQCGKPMTIGVLYRVMELADREKPLYAKGSPGVHSLIPLPEVLGELFHVGPASKKVAGVYGKLINEFGSEFNVLLHAPLTDLSAVSSMLGEAVRRIREKKVIRQPGFDGEFGVIKVFSEDEQRSFGGQLNLFGIRPAKPRKKKKSAKPVFLSAQKTTQQPVTKQLNREQLAAVKSDAACILVNAGPGTGKTHTLVQRVRRLLAAQNGSITVITFTNKAAEEIRQRLCSGNTEKAHVRVDTFHSFCLYWLRQSCPDIHLAGPLMRNRLLTRLYPKLSGKARKEMQREMALFLSSQYRLPGVFPDEFEPYFAELRKNNQLDLDEVIPACTDLMGKKRSFYEMIQQSMDHLLIDEFQDLNASQFELVRQLGQSTDIFAIGDPDQAIYGFRGARPEWFYRFIRDFDPEQHFLVNNYRSSSVILDAAQQVIAAGRTDDTARQPTAVRKEKGALYTYQAPHPAAEAAFIAGQIQELIGGTTHREIDQLVEGQSGLSLSDIAVLYRTGKQADLLAKALEKRSIPYQVLDVLPFFVQGDTRIIYYWVLLAADRIDKAELLFLLGQQKGIGVQSLAIIEALIPEMSVEPFTELQKQLSALPAKIAEKISWFGNLRIECQVRAKKSSVRDVVTALYKNLELNPETPELTRFSAMANSADSLVSFAEHLRGSENSVVYDERAESVLLATLHASKGLEFEAVFMSGCEEGLLPLFPRTSLSPEDQDRNIQEERRLFYVGLTRAAQIAYLSWSGERVTCKGREKKIPSRFLADIPASLFSRLPGRKGQRKKKSSFRQLRLF